MARGHADESDQPRTLATVALVAVIEGAGWFAVLYLLALAPFGLLFP